MNRIILYFVFLSIFYPISGRSQNYSEDFDSIYSKMIESYHCKINTSIVVYSDRDKMRKIYELNTQLSKSGDLFRSRIDDVETIYNSDYYAVVDYADKTVKVGNTQKFSNKDKKFFEEVESLNDVDTNITITLLKNENNIRTYKLDYPIGEIISLTVTLDMEKRTLKRVEYDYNPKLDIEGHFVVIDYTLFNYPTTIAPNVYKGLDILIRKGKTFTLTQSYRTYELLNYYK